MLIRAVAVLSIIAASPAEALRCTAPSVAQSHDIAQTRPEAFTIALGALRRTGEDVPQGDATAANGDGVGYSFAARFEGRVLGADGTFAERRLHVTVEVTCRSVWCGGESLSENGLYFLRENGAGGHILDAGPCPMFFFDRPEETLLREVIGNRD